MLASPKIILPDSATDLRAYPDDILSCSASGTSPIYIALIRHSTVLANATFTQSIEMSEEGNYSCIATNKYGTDTGVIPVILLGKTLLCKTVTYFLPLDPM